jgi:hypothetical protein
MSGKGVISVRLPHSLLAATNKSAAVHSISIHEVTARIFDRIPSLTDDELMGLPEPPVELENSRVSLHLGSDTAEQVIEAAFAADLSTSNIVRRVLHGILVAGTIEFVQRGKTWQLRVIS